MKSSHIDEMRAFNRFYTSLIGILNKTFNSSYSLPEGRVLQILHLHPGISAREIIAELNIDKSYLSRILLTFGKRGLVSRKVSQADARSIQLSLTAKGQKEFQHIDDRTHEQVSQILSRLSESERDSLIKSMRAITRILKPIRAQEASITSTSNT